MEPKTVLLGVHWKQGDEFESYLEDASGDVSLALDNWAERFRQTADAMCKLSSVLKGTEARAHGDTHLIEIIVDKPLADAIVADQEIQAIGPQIRDEYDDEVD